MARTREVPQSAQHSDRRGDTSSADRGSTATERTGTVVYRTEPRLTTTAATPKKKAAEDATQQIYDRQPARTKCEERVES
jgi:hypothetical protein